LSEERTEEVRNIIKSLKEPIIMTNLVEFGADQKQLEGYITGVLSHITKGGKVRKGVFVPPFEVISGTIANLGIENILSLLVNPRIGEAPKIDEVNRIVTAMRMLDSKWVPTPVVHPQYSGMPTADNLERWKDQWGYNIFDTPKRKLADHALLKYEARHKKKLNKPEVRPSDPVEHAPEPFTGRRKV